MNDINLEQVPEGLLEAMTKRLRRESMIGVGRRVVGYYEDVGYDGYCSTCAYSFPIVEYFLDNQTKYTERNIELGELMIQLFEEDK